MENKESENQNCEHKYVYMRSESYKRPNGRNNMSYYHADYFFCEKCLDEQIKEKRCDDDNEIWRLPEWAKVITNTIPSETSY